MLTVPLFGPADMLEAASTFATEILGWSSFYAMQTGYRTIWTD
jgi:hypothetical protein